MWDFIEITTRLLKIEMRYVSSGGYPSSRIVWGQADDLLSFRPGLDTLQKISSRLTRVDRVSNQPTCPAAAIGAGIDDCTRCIQQHLLQIYNCLKQRVLREKSSRPHEMRVSSSNLLRFSNFSMVRNCSTSV